MKIAIIGGVDDTIKCGVMDYTKMLTSSLRENGVSVVEAANYNNSEEAVEISNWHKLGTYIRLVKRLKKEKVDIVQIEYPAKAYDKSIAINLLPLICRLHRLKCVFTSHEYSNRSFLGKLRQLPSFLFANAIIVVEPQFEKDIKKLPFCGKKVRTICIGSNINKSNATENELMELRRKVAPDGELIMAYFGFINEFKCFKELITAISMLNKDGKLKSKLLIIGTLSEEDEYQKMILQLIKSENLQDKVYITGYLENGVEDYLAASDFAVLPFAYGVSVRNGSFLAAYQENIDIITSKPKSYFPYEDVYYFEDNTAHAIYDGILKVQQTTGKKYNRHIDFNWDSVAKKHVKLYEDMM